MNDIKTVTHEGKVYQIGQDYLFSDTKGTWVYSKLLGIKSDDISPFKTYILCWKFIKDMPPSEEFGTITPAPIELIDGAAYMFDEQAPYSNKNCIGIYEKHGNKFHLKNYATLVKVCTNIRLMTVESK
jgi:hypothetical protein